MRLAENSVQKRKEEKYGGDGELFFCSAKKRIAQIIKQSAGKVLLVGDIEHFFLFSEAVCSPKTVCILQEEDGLSLFSMPDDVSCVVGAGAESALKLARFFAEIRRIICHLFPTDATFAGVCGEEEILVVGGKEVRAKLAKGQIYCDEELLSPTRYRAYAKARLYELQKFEGRALHYLTGKPEIESGVVLSENNDFSSLILDSYRIGELCGEGGMLAKLCQSEWRAFLWLLSLYSAFFDKGKPRRYFMPNYQKRQEITGKNSSPAPTLEEYALRAMALEKYRGFLQTELKKMTQRRGIFAEEMRNLSASKLPQEDNYDALKYLPEYRFGLCSIIRDFGLLEFEWKMQ